jgi:hypothetical protein
MTGVFSVLPLNYDGESSLVSCLLISSWTLSLTRKWLNSVSLPSLIWFAGNNHSSAASKFLRPNTCAHESWDSRPLKRLSSTSSLAHVEGGNHVFGGVSQLARLLAIGDLCLRWSTLLLVCTASSGTTTLIGIMSLSASGSAAGYVTVNPTFPIRLISNR